MTFVSFLARQLGNPSGIFGRLLFRLLNNYNMPINRRTIHHLSLTQNTAILDVGFGGGNGLGLLNQQVPFGFIGGVDISQSMVNWNRRKFRDRIAAGTMRLEAAGVESMPFEAALFNAAISVNSLYFWPEPEMGAAEIARVLKDDGVLALGLRPKKTLGRKKLANHGFNLLEEAELEQLFCRNGFARTEIFSEADGELGMLFVLAYKSFSKGAS